MKEVDEAVNWMWRIRRAEGIAAVTFQIQGGELMIAVSVLSPVPRGES